MRKLHHRATAGIAAVAAILVLGTTPAYAGDNIGAHVTYLRVEGSTVRFGIDKQKNGTPACGPSNDFAFDANGSAGQAQLAIVLTAKSLGRAIDLNGNGSCSVISSVETLSFVSIEAS